MGMRAALALLAVAAALAAPSAAPARDGWFATADKHCATATRDGKLLVATILTVKTQVDAMAFLRDGVAIHARLLARLRAAGPPPSARRFMTLLARSVALDRKGVAELERGVDRAKVQHWIDEGTKIERAARRAATALGVLRCAAYLDPATYK
jgi:hypothetical protein